jgi:hypothetical protein
VYASVYWSDNTDDDGDSTYLIESLEEQTNHTQTPGAQSRVCHKPEHFMDLSVSFIARAPCFQAASRQVNSNLRGWPGLGTSTLLESSVANLYALSYACGLAVRCPAALYCHFFDLPAQVMGTHTTAPSLVFFLLSLQLSCTAAFTEKLPSNVSPMINHAQSCRLGNSV